MSRTCIIVTAVLALSGLTGCGGTEPTPAAPGPATTTASATSSEAPAASEPSTPLHGSWRLELTDEQIGAALTAGGYGSLTEKFLVAEQIDGSITQVLTIQDDRFAFAYLSGDDPWHVGWTGPVTVDGDTVVLQDEFSGSEDTLRWTVDRGELRFEVVEVADLELKDIPNEAYFHAYLLSAPFQRTDCTPIDAADGCEG